MGRDTIQLERAVSTISHEYLLEFTSDYGIPEGLHPELPNPEDTIVNFLEGKIRVYTRFFEFANFCIPRIQYHQISLRYPRLLPGGQESVSHRRRLAYKRSEGWDASSRLLFRCGCGSIEHVSYPHSKTTRRTVMPSRVEPKIFPGGRYMDLFNLISAPNPTKVKTVTSHLPVEVALDLGKEMAAIGHTVNKRRHKGGKEDTGANAPRKVLRRDHDTSRPTQSTLGGKSLAAMGLKTGSTFSAPASQETPADVSDPDPLSSSEVPTGHMATTEVQDLFSAESPESGKSASIPSGDGSPGGIYQPGWGVINSCRLDTPDACQDVVDHIAPPGYFSELCYLPNADFLSQYNMNLARQVAMGSQLRLRFEQEVRLLKKARAKIARRDQRILMREEEIKKLDQEVKSLQAVEVEVHDLRIRTNNLETLPEAEVTNLQAQVVGEEKMKAAFEAFKKYEDDRVEQRCAEMDARLDKLSVDFDEELYPHMLTAIAGRRWVIGHGLRLAVMKCDESSKLRKAFANVVSAGLAKGMSEGLKYGIEHGKAGRDLTIVKAYDPEADGKYVQALQKLKDLKYPLLEQLKKLKYAPME
ncbi:hypothetical protein Tco_1020528, partial [Tanacetum coccineum]